jgi:hypothetical protein
VDRNYEEIKTSPDKISGLFKIGDTVWNVAWVIYDLKSWPIEFANTLPGQMLKVWNKDIGRAEEIAPGLFVFDTGGCSYNDEILGAVKQSEAWIVLEGNSLYLPGGLQIIAVSDKVRAKLDDLMDKVRDWAWKGGEAPRAKAKTKAKAR